MLHFDKSFSKKHQENTVSETIERRISIVRVVYILVFFGILARLYYWQISQSSRLKALAEQQYFATKTTHGSRGTIYTADGFPLVTNQYVYSLFAEPHRLEQSPESIASVLAPIIAKSEIEESASPEGDISPKVLEWQSTISKKIDKKLRWVMIKRKLPEKARDEIAALHMAGLGFDREEIRSYPEASMAAQVVGFVGYDQQGEETGYFGIEGFFNKELQGKMGYQKQEKDAGGIPIAVGSRLVVEEQSGRDIELTISRDIQFLLEQKLKEGMEKYGSKTAEGVIMDPKTGDILAMATFPSYDPKKYFEFQKDNYKNLLISDLYEPGSTMKILTVSAGVDAGVIDAKTVCDRCAGPRVIGKYTIKTWNDKYSPNVTIEDGLAHSDNTAMIFIEEKVGAERFVEYLKKFGLDKKTEVDLQGESLPPFREQWKEIDLATSSFGQGIAVNGMQVLRIAQVIANNGKMMKPRIVKGVKDSEKEIPVLPKELEQVISPESADAVTEMMVRAVKTGDAKWAVPKGYKIAGKTGTAQIPVDGHYDAEKTVASFVGFAPADDPKFVMLIKLREPSSSQWGSETAAPLWFSIAKELFVRMRIPPTEE